MNRKQRIEEKLKASLSPILHLDLVDESYMHAVPAGAESHFKVLVVSETFENIPVIERHRQLNRLLADELQGGLHALTLHTWTPEEWYAKGGAPESPPCLGGSKAR
jgi:BolA family transcriptional regulator, general stress-responsive regulator